MQQNSLPVFWSEKVGRGGTPIVFDEDEGSTINITLITLGDASKSADTAKSGKPIHVQMEWQDDAENEDSTQSTILCTLESGRVDQVKVDYILSDDVVVKHTGDKNLTVYLNGIQYLDVSKLQDQQDEEKEEEEEEEEVGGQTPKLIELKGKAAADSSQSDEQKQKESKKQLTKTSQKQDQVAEQDKKDAKAKSKQDKDKKRKQDDTGGETDEKQAQKKTKQDFSEITPEMSSALETFTKGIIAYLKRSEGKAELGDIGSNVKKPKGVPKKLKLRKVILDNSDTFKFDASTGMVSLLE